MADEDVEDAIEQAAIDGIKRVSGDQGSVEMFSPEERLKHLDRKRAQGAARSGFGGLRMVKLIPPGAD